MGTDLSGSFSKLLLNLSSLALKCIREADFLLNPNKNEKYFYQYYNFVRKIHVQKDVRARRLVYGYNLILVLMGVNFIWLGLLSKSNELVIIAQFDALTYLSGKQRINALGILSTSLLIFSNLVLLLDPNLSLLDDLYRILIERNESSFSFKYPILFNQNKTLRKKLHFDPTDACAQIRRTFLITLNIFFSILYSMDVLVLYLYPTFMTKFWYFRDEFQAPGESIWYLVVALVRCNLQGLFIWIYLFSYSHVISFSFTCLFTLLSIAFLKFKRVHFLLLSLQQKIDRKRQFFVPLYSCFLVNYVHTLRWFFAVDRCYSRIFLVYMLTFCPINVVISQWIIEGGMPLAGIITILFWISAFTNILFVGHLILVRCTRHIHRPCKPLLHIFVSCSNWNNISTRTRLRLAAQIDALHLRKKKYGFTYGSFGLVSMFAFVRYLLLYGEFMMSSYQLVRKQVI